MSEPSLMTIEQAKGTSFRELAKNIRVNIEKASQPGGRPLDNRLLLEFVEILEQKIGGHRPELPPPPARPGDPEYDRLPRPKPTKAQQQTKKRLKQEIKAAQRALASEDEQRRAKTHNRLDDLRRQLADLVVKIRISGLPPYARKIWLRGRTSIRDHLAKLAAYEAEMMRYKQETADIRRAIERWDSLYGNNPDYEVCLRIVDHLRADVESYARGEFPPRATKLPWRFLPPGHRDVSWVIDEITRLRSKYPQLRVDEERLRYAQSLGLLRFL
jgi:DNA repair exonuclease SbcCD ATPase subunit